MNAQKGELIGCVEVGDNAARLEVVLTDHDGNQIVALQLSTWHETLGWQVQKTIPFAAEKIGQLQRVLTQTRNLVEDRRTPAGAVARVIDFALRGPGPQAPRPASQPTIQSEAKSASN